MATGSNEKMNAGSIYRVGSSGEVYVYDSVSLTDSVIDKSTLGALSKISVTDNEELIVISATSLVGTLNRTNGTDYVFESYPSALPTFALSSTGGNLIVAPNAETALVKGECPEG